MPDTATAPALAAALAAAGERLRPASPEAFATLISRLLDFAVAFAKGRFSADAAEATAQKRAAVAFYRQDLGDLPADLLEQAVRAATAAWIYPGLPTPAEVRACVSAEMSRRRVEVARLQLVLGRVGVEKPAVLAAAAKGAEAPARRGTPPADETRRVGLASLGELLTRLQGI